MQQAVQHCQDLKKDELSRFPENDFVLNRISTSGSSTAFQSRYVFTIPFSSMFSPSFDLIFFSKPSSQLNRPHRVHC
ncbi:hypothetical protein ANCDUO_04460 [Ancylostoma duodenale]|uniref:Uncharacterized protein n=1 Tax=Ancylostoma duodenale TaxID=51022 RepID=A0A0C2H0W9_9BILA|nr:hypothetical protein ANCDUO_04460 [Ancylostoma duodenale]